MEEQEDSEDIALWLEHTLVEIRIFLQNCPATLMTTNRDLKEHICFMLDRATAEKDCNEVAVVRGKLENMMYKDSMGFIVRSRFKKSLKIFGINLFSTYVQTLENNWAMAVRKMQQCLNSWHTRVFNSGFQKAKTLKICACLSPPPGPRRLRSRFTGLSRLTRWK